MVHTKQMESDMTDKFTHPKDAKEDHKWQTNDGRKVSEIFHFDSVKAPKTYPIYASINGIVLTFTDDGVYDTDVGKLHLIDAPAEHTVWVTLDFDGTFSLLQTKPPTGSHANGDRIACRKFTITAGRFDDEK